MNVELMAQEMSEQPTFKLTDSGNAERFAYQHRDKARYVAPWKKWLVWDGKRWARDDLGRVDLLAKATVRSLDDELAREPSDDRRKLIRAHATKSETRGGRESLVALARAELAATPEDFDVDPWLLNVANGTIDLRTGQLRPHARENMLTKLAPVDFDPSAEAPLWDAFLQRVMAGNEGLIDYLQRLIGYALTSSTKEQICAFSWGAGANGKSVFHKVVAHMLGDYAVTASDGLFFVAKGEVHPTSVASLAGARFVICAEVPEQKHFNELLLKNLTGGDTIKTRRMHQDEWEFVPVCKLFFCGNHKPVIRGTDDGIWRRMRLVPWSVQIPQPERDRDLDMKLGAELPGILAWALRGCIAWQKEGLAEPPEVERATAEYREESDPLNEFFAARCEFGDFKIGRAALRMAYETYCRETGAQPLGAKRFAEGLKKRGIVDGGSVRGGPGETYVNAWRGVRLRLAA